MDTSHSSLDCHQEECQVEAVQGRVRNEGRATRFFCLDGGENSETTRGKGGGKVSPSSLLNEYAPAIHVYLLPAAAEGFRKGLHRALRAPEGDTRLDRDFGGDWRGVQVE